MALIETDLKLPIHDIQPSVIQEFEDLLREGYDVCFDNTPDKYAMSPEAQLAVDMEIAELEQRTVQAIEDTNENPMLLPIGRSAFKQWGPLTKRAIALKNIYDADSATLGEGIDPTIYDRPLFAAEEDNQTYEFSANDVMRLTLGDDKASKKIQEYLDFIPTPIDENSRKIWQGARDGAGVRTRATSAMTEVTRYVSENYPKGSEITLASLACGAAAPIYELFKGLESKGIEVKEAVLADFDAMALASAFSLAEAEGVQDKVSLKLENLVDMKTLEARDLTEFIEPGSVDVVDLLGLFEYFPRPLAVSLLRQVQKIVKPGGMIIFGNMIDKRPQQTFFTDVSLWPPLNQRSLREIFDIIEESGFDSRRDARILLPPQGVYAVAAIEVPQLEDPDPLAA